ncbi:MAG: hypothetical protein OEL83_05650 [Desulforhopalus sp.]|nr:hypothetical protein [Desulforhopalus sp.]
MTRNCRTFLSLPIFVALLSLPIVSLAAEQTPTAQGTGAEGKAVWAWAGQSGGEDAIFISRKVGSAWEEPQKVSTGEGVNIVPAVTNPSADDLIVVWSNFTGSQAQLRYRYQQDGQWSEEKEYYTGLSSNMAPSVAVDRTGKIWLVWAGFNGVSDEIYFATWNETSFTTAQALTANDIPDIQPILGIDGTTGTPWVQWQQFSANGYVDLESTWNGSAWSEPVLVAAEASSTADETAENQQPASKKAQTDDQLEIEIPSFIVTPESASIHVPGYAVQSLPIRRVTPIE